MFVNDLFEKGPQKSSQEPRQSETEFGYRKLDPLIHKARQKYPLASNDTEALALFIADKEEADVKDLETKVGSVNQNAQTLIRRQQQVLQKQNKELDAIEQQLNSTKTDNVRQEKDIEQLVKSVNDANARYAAQEERFRDLTARVAAQKLTQTDVDAANIAKELERSDDARSKTFGAQQIVRNDVNEGGDWDEGNTEPPNNFAVYINGKKWKVFKGHGHFAGDFREIQQHRKLQNWAQAKSASTGKEWKVYVTGEPVSEGVAEDSLNEFAPGNGGGESGRWYSDDEINSIVGDGWYQELDLSGANLGVSDDQVPKKWLIKEAQAWLDNQGYNVHVLNVKVNEDDCDWFIEGSFQNNRFAKKGVAEATESDIEKHIMEMRHAGYDISEGHGSYYCSTKKKMVQRKGPKQSRSSK